MERFNPQRTVVVVVVVVLVVVAVVVVVVVVGVVGVVVVVAVVVVVVVVVVGTVGSILVTVASPLSAGLNRIWTVPSAFSDVPGAQHLKVTFSAIRVPSSSLQILHMELVTSWSSGMSSSLST